MIATCIPTLRPLFLIIFRRPGRDNYRRRQPFNQGSSSRDRHKRIGGISDPISDSTTAIGHADDQGSWIELGPDPPDSNTNSEILRTMEFDVTSHKSARRPGEEESFRIAGGNGV